MQIDLISQQKINFKQLKLSATELKTGANKFKQILAEPANPKLCYKLLEFLEPHLNKEVDLKNYANGYARRNFSVFLYLNFFKSLENNKKNNGTFDCIINDLNNSLETYISKPVLKDSSIYQGYNVSKVSNLVQNLCNYIGVTKECLLEKSLKFPLLQCLNEENLSPKINYITRILGFDKEEYVGLFNNNPKALILPANKILDVANDIMQILDLTPEKFRKCVAIDPHFLTIQDLKSHIHNIAEFLDISENNVKTIIKENPKIATVKLENLKTNFYSMKDYLNVDRRKMSELSTIVTKFIVARPEYTKNNIENVAKELKILPKTLIKFGNDSPTLYLKGPCKVKSLINFVSENLGYSYEDARKYIVNNLNLLAYRLTNIIEKTKANAETLNEKLNIDAKSFREMLRNNSYIMGCHNELINQNIDGMCEYLNIDRTKYSKIIKKYPYIITMYPKDIITNLSDFSKILNISIEEMKNMAIKEPSLLRCKKEYLKFNINHNSKLLGLSEEVFIELGKNNPILFTQKYKSSKNIKEITLLLSE